MKSEALKNMFYEILSYVTYDKFCMFLFSSLSSFIFSGHWCGFGTECLLVVLHLTAAAAVEIQEEQRC